MLARAAGDVEAPFLLLVPSGFPPLRMAGLFMVQRSGFSLAKVQGASGVALDPWVLFSVLVGCLVSGLAVAGVGGCGCRRVCPFLVEAVGCWLAFWLLSERTGGCRACVGVLCLCGSRGWVAGVHAFVEIPQLF